MSRPAHVYQIYIAAHPEQVWTAITDSDWTRRYLHATAFVEPPVAGQAYLTVLPDGRPAIDGMIEEMSPPAAGRPGRFVQTWHIRYNAELEAERPGRVEWTVTEAGDGSDPGPAGAQRPGGQPAHLGDGQGRLGLGAGRHEDLDRNRPVAPRSKLTAGAPVRWSRPRRRPSRAAPPLL